MHTTPPAESIPDGLLRFRIPLEGLGLLVKQTRNNKNPALFLLEAGARNHLFRLEALCRIYRKTIDRKIFDPLYEVCKEAEDQLGKIDYFNSFYKEFLNQKKIPVSFITYFLKHRDNEIRKLNDAIGSGNLLTGEKSLNDIFLPLKSIKWPARESERKGIALFLVDQIDRFQQQFKDGVLNFHDLENGVHEFRRKLRWISIYAQSLNGLIQLKKTRLISPELHQYMEREIIESIFNRMPVTPKGVKPLLIKSSHFYALSWIIQESGKLKDAGLKILAIRDALRESGIKNKETLNTIKKQLLPTEFISTEEITENMEKIADDFIYRHNVLNLIRRDLMRSIQA